MKFQIGQLISTPACMELLGQLKVTPMSLVSRHIRGDWGDLDQQDKRANDDAVKYGDRIFSAYKIGKHKIWVITESDRSSTCVLLPSDY